MKHIGLFEGIGGFSLAGRWMGWETIAWCEWNEFCQKILRYHFPEAEGYGDITTTDFTKYANKIDILTGGFPCQPFSTAGSRGGQDDHRYLWPQMRRAIREIKPRIVVAENVAGLFTILEPASLSEVESKEIQLFSENPDYQINATIERLQRRVIATIIEEIRAEGYVLPTLADGTPIVCCIPACAVNAPHRRDRIWFVAYRADAGFEGLRESKKCIDRSEIITNTNKQHGNLSGFRTGEISQQQASGVQECITTNPASKGRKEREQIRGRQDSKEDRTGVEYGVERFGNDGPTSNTNGAGWAKECQPTTQPNKQERQYSEKDFGSQPGSWENFPTQPPVRSRNDGLPRELVGITVSKHRNESIKAYGNAIVPQVALMIFKAIEQYEDSINPKSV